jgi:hypothetical protein
MQQNMSNRFSDLRATRFSRDDSINSALEQVLVKQPQLRGLARTVNAFEGDKKIHEDVQDCEEKGSASCHERTES